VRVSRIHVVTLARLNRALARVVRELERHGFWDEALEDVDVFLKHDGRLPAVFRATPVQTRWRFVRNMGRAIRSGERRWY
jgi:hypothetical protein